MSNLNRRQMLQLLGAAGAASALSVAVPAFAAPTPVQDAGTIGRVLRMTRGGITVHTYVAPDASVSVTSHIIESANSLIVVDAQFVQTFARDLRAYVDSLGKPIDRVILSHAHPDHFLGANLFADAPFITSAVIAEEVAAYDAGGGLAGVAALIGESEVPDAVRIPDGAISDGELVIDGVTYTISTVQNAEATNTLVIGIPQAGAIIVQDLLYNGNHFFPGVDRANWIAQLGALAGTLDGYDTVLVGHGLPAGKGAFDHGAQYLAFVEEQLAAGADAESLVAALTSRYPAHEGGFILTFWAQFLGG